MLINKSIDRFSIGLSKVIRLSLWFYICFQWFYHGLRNGSLLNVLTIAAKIGKTCGNCDFHQEAVSTIYSKQNYIKEFDYKLEIAIA